MIKKLYFNVFGPEDNNTEEDQNSFSLNYNTETKEFYAVDTTVAEETASSDPSEPVATPVVNQLSFGTLDTEGGVPNVILSGGTNIEIVDDFINCTLTGVSQLTNDAGYITIDQLPSGDGEPIYYTAGEGLALSGTQFRLTADIPTYTAGYGLSLSGNEFNVAIPIPTGIGSFNATDTKYQLQHMGFAINDYIPTNLSHLNNDIGFITLSSVPTNISELNNDIGFITINDVPSGASYIAGNGVTINGNNISIDLNFLSGFVSSQLQNINNNPSGGYDNNTLSAVSAQVTTNKTNISTLSSHLISAKIHINTLSANLATSGMNIRTLSTRVNTISSDIENLNNQVADINNQLQNYNGNISGYSLSGNYLGNLVGENGIVVTNNSGYIFSIDQDWLNNKLQNINNNPSGGYDNNTLSAVSAQVTTNKTNIAILSSHLLSANVTNISTISANLVNAKTNISTLSTNLGALSSNYINTKVTCNTLTANIATISTNYAKSSAIPTKVSQLANDAGYITSAQLPSDGGEPVYYTAGSGLTLNGTEFSLTAAIPNKTSQLINDSGFITINQVPEGAVYVGGAGISVANNTISLTAAIPPDYSSNISSLNTQVGTISSHLVSAKSNVSTLSTHLVTARTNIATISTNFARKTEIPTKTSQLTNDSGFITAVDVPEGAVYVGGTGISIANNTISLTATIPTKTSQLTNDASFATIGQIPNRVSDLTNDIGYITSAQLPEGAVYVGGTGISVANNTISLTAAIPTKTSQLINDSGFISNVPTKVSQLANDAGYITNAQLPDLSNYVQTSTLSGYATTSSVSALNTNLTTLSTTVADVDFKVDTVSTTLDSYNFIVENNWIVLPISASVTVQNNRRYICRAPSGNNNFIRLNCPTTAQGLVDGFKFGLFIESLLSQGAIKIRDKNHPIILGNQVVEWISQDDGGNEDEFELNQTLTYAEFVFTASDNSWHCINLSLPAGQYVNVGEVLLETLQNSPNFKQQLRQELGLVN